LAGELNEAKEEIHEMAKLNKEKSEAI